MSENLVNDVKRLERISDELSGTNQKFLAAASRVVALIIKTVPSDMYGSDLGMGYRVNRRQNEGYPPWLELERVKAPSLFRKRENLKIGVSHKNVCDLWIAHQFADDVTKGLLGQICDKLNQCLARSTHELIALEKEETLLKKNLSQ